MTDEQLLKRVGTELLGWEYLKSTANLPAPLDPLVQALDGTRRPIFWATSGEDGAPLFFVAEPGEKAVRWNPLEDERQLERVLMACGQRGGKISVHEGSISVQTPDGRSITSTGSSTRDICAAALDAVSSAP